MDYNRLPTMHIPEHKKRFLRSLLEVIEVRYFAGDHQAILKMQLAGPIIQEFCSLNAAPYSDHHNIADTLRGISRRLAYLDLIRPMKVYRTKAFLFSGLEVDFVDLKRFPEIFKAFVDLGARNGVVGIRAKSLQSEMRRADMRFPIYYGIQLEEWLTRLRPEERERFLAGGQTARTVMDRYTGDLTIFKIFGAWL